ncbi:antibiotic biosynthesis monooxygenase [Virgibacillus halodenitrificans]|uniref:antibiotic biosynthesis monooxygenase family protein n=1 Tax=Virgibacillus halodenitrificans TaxID=1482 RepID=UPI001368183E|nr:antibiotic biosynthesis monooxygenase [Virgibacillus halodenitrificans]MYL45129.1 antibiotic biosynthesis monooxygenase [Virgibacillus halodenitrificans]
MEIIINSVERDEKVVIEERDNHISINDAVYEIIDQSGALENSGVIVLNNVPVFYEAREKFEQRFLNRPKMIEAVDGFISIRVMRPLEGDTYTIMTQWDSESSFRSWQESKAYQHAHKNRGTKQGIDQQKNVLKRKTNYHVYQVGS